MDVSRWLTGSRQKNPINLEFGLGEWCTANTPLAAKSLLVVWGDSAEPDMLELYELEPGKMFFAPRWTAKLAGVDLTPLFVNRPIPSLRMATANLDQASIDAMISKGACKGETEIYQCKSVPLEVFADALAEKYGAAH
jgi:hypothetical protein